MFVRRTLSVSVALALVVGLMPMVAYAQVNDTNGLEAGSAIAPMGTQAVLAGGVDGTCAWSIDGQGLLTISPRNGVSGQLDSYDKTSVPWYASKAMIKSVYAASGVRFGTSCRSMFSGCNSLESVDLSNADMSLTEDLASMFEGCNRLVSVNADGWVMPKANNLEEMFEGCNHLESIDLSRWSIPRVTNVSYMFSGCSSLKSLGVSNWDTSAITNMKGMFSGCSALRGLDLHKWNVSSVTGSADNSPSLNDSSTSNGMGCMFLGCSSLEWVDLAGWSTAQVKDMQRMFGGCSSLRYIYVDEGWSVLNAGSGYLWGDRDTGIFTGCVNLVGQAGTPYDSRYTGTEYARVDSLDKPGYLTYRTYNIAHADIALSPSIYDYDGTAHEPAVSVTLNGKALTRGSDFTVSYSNNIGAGTASATVRGAGDYIGTATRSFQIQGIDLSAATVTTAFPSYDYTGTEIRPSVTVTLDGRTLYEGVDYTVAFSDNRNAGTATVTVTGKGSYSGIAQGSFKITGGAPGKGGVEPGSGVRNAPLTLGKAKTVTLKYAKLKKKAQVVSRPFVVRNAQTKVSYNLVNGGKRFSMNKGTGKLTVKKGVAKGTYKLKVKVTAAGNSRYRATTLTTKVTVKVLG